jgi:hypothetical protein
MAKPSIKPEVIVATSAKANGAFIAIRPKSVETADEPAAIWHVRRTEVFSLDPLSGLLGFLGTRAYLVRGLRAATARGQAPRARTPRGAPDSAARRRY